MDSKCKICRRAGEKLFLKGERCYTPKCTFLRKPYKPGMHGKKRRRVSDYGMQLTEKQKLRNMYGLREKQFRNLFKESSSHKGDIGSEFLMRLEKRLDNIVFRLGLAKSRSIARQLVNHGHIFVNGKKVDIPSFRIKKGDIISIKEKSKSLPIIKDIELHIQGYQVPSWLSLNKEKMEGKIINDPIKEELGELPDLQMIVEFYSR